MTTSTIDPKEAKEFIRVHSILKKQGIEIKYPAYKKLKEKGILIIVDPTLDPKSPHK